MSNDLDSRPHAAGWPAPTPSPETDLDTQMQERLARLAARRAQSTDVAPTKRTSARSGKRRHAARGSRAATLLLSIAGTGGLAAFLAATDPGVSAAPAAPAGIVSDPATTTPATVAPATAAPSSDTPTVAATAAPSAELVQVNGQSFTNKWGDVQVQASFAPDGTLVSVDALQTPYRDGKSVRINDRAVPRLTSAALTAQSARIDTVSGATYTSVGYQQSLQSAIDIAVASGIPTPAAAA